MINDEMYLNFENLYKDYERIVKNPQPRLLLTMDKMYEEILEEYSDTNNIISICSFDELICLKDCTSKDYKLPSTDIEFLLENKHLLRTYPNVNMNNKICELINIALKSIDDKQIKHNDKINYFILGYIRVMGILSINEVTTLLVKEKYFDNEELALTYIKNNKFFNYYAKFENDNIRWRDYENYAIEELIENKKDVEHFCLNEIDEPLYSRIFEKGFDYKNPYIKTMLDELNKYPTLFALLNKNLNNCILTGSDRSIILKELKKFDQLVKIDNIVKLNSIILEAIDNSPSGYLFGLTPAEYEIKLKGLC